MTKSRLEWKVGVFVFIGLVLVAVLMIEFSKGLTFFQPTYDIYLGAPNVGGLKVRADVLMAGVKVGTVSGIRLSPTGTNVNMTLRLSRHYVIHRDARFSIEQSGFLGDNYVAIVPTENKLPPFQGKDVAEAEAPFNLQEFTRSASGFILRVDETFKKLNDSLAEITRLLLNPETLTNLSLTAANLRAVSERALATVDDIHLVVSSNSPSVSVSVSNLVLFSQQLNQFVGEFRTLLATNSDDIGRTVKNVESSSESLKTVMSDLKAGKGLAGNLLQDEQLTATVSQIANNLSITTSNLNRLGLWKMLWQHKPPKTSEPREGALSSPKGSEN